MRRPLRFAFIPLALLASDSVVFAQAAESGAQAANLATPPADCKSLAVRGARATLCFCDAARSHRSRGRAGDDQWAGALSPRRRYGREPLHLFSAPGTGARSLTFVRRTLADEWGDRYRGSTDCPGGPNSGRRSRCPECERAGRVVFDHGGRRRDPRRGRSPRPAHFRGFSTRQDRNYTLAQPRVDTTGFLKIPARRVEGGLATGGGPRSAA